MVSVCARKRDKRAGNVEGGWEVSDLGVGEVEVAIEIGEFLIHMVERGSVVVVLTHVLFLHSIFSFLLIRILGDLALDHLRLSRRCGSLRDAAAENFPVGRIRGGFCGDGWGFAGPGGPGFAWSLAGRGCGVGGERGRGCGRGRALSWWDWVFFLCLPKLCGVLSDFAKSTLDGVVGGTF